MSTGKTHKGIKKRFKVTASGKVMRRQIGARHLMSTKSPDRKRRLGRWTTVHKTNLKSLRKQYGKI